MFSRTIKICILAVVFALGATACKSTKPKLLTQNDADRSHVTLSQPIEEGRDAGK